MSFYSELKDILSIKSDVNNAEIKVTNAHSKKYPNGVNHIISGSKPITLTILLYRLTNREDKKLQILFKKYFGKGDVYFLSENKAPLLDRLYKYKDSEEDNRILNFFKNILSSKDWEALRASLYLRSEFMKHHNVSSLKQDIVMRFGERGNTISNLCTAGYFEEVMIPLFNYSPTEFHSYYDIAIDRGITALFVNSKMDVPKITEEIKQRIMSAKAYGLKSFHIHGIGKKNTEKIKQCLEREKTSLDFVDKNVFHQDGVMVIEIIL